jgi:hypothetical protein
VEDAAVPGGHQDEAEARAQAPDEDTEMIINAIMEAIQTFLVADMYTDVSSTDVTRLYDADSVYIGRILDDPEEKSPFVEIHSSYPGGDFPTEPLRSRKDPGTDGALVAITGGTAVDMRFNHRFYVRGVQYFTARSYTRGECRDYAATFRNRLKQSIISNNVLGVEAGGERDIGGANKGCIQRYSAREAGGPETEWIWECYFLLEYQTEYTSS